ncbi:MAG: hypothetical protein JWL82_41 [Parcubacteria group bacterium]|nr:hypothetical protein [Parcubacteria group bacterium]
MKKAPADKSKKNPKGKSYAVMGALVLVVVGVFVVLPEVFAGRYDRAEAQGTSTVKSLLMPKMPAAPVTLDTKEYDRLMLKLANYPVSTASTTASTATASTTVVKVKPWPANTTVYPKVGAILPYKRVIAYYGNFYSTKMGVLGEYSREVVKQKLLAEMKAWDAADPTTPTIAAIDYIAVTAQGTPQSDGTYRLRMPGTEIQKAIDLAAEVHGIVILDVQVGLSDLPRELPRLEPYLKQANVHLAIDPEFAMHNGVKPGRVIGTMSSSDVNYAATFLQKLVIDNNLPPKILVVHRFTEDMVTGYRNIKPLPEVQIVVDMDGWGFAAKKLNTYKQVITTEPIQFAGFKLFYKNDLKPPSTRMLTPAELLKLQPAPIFIQYQ